jgi:HEAT repeat protein
MKSPNELKEKMTLEFEEAGSEAEAVAVIKKYIGNDDPDVRFTAATFCSDFPTHVPMMTELLEKHLPSSDPHLRAGACIGLSETIRMALEEDGLEDDLCELNDELMAIGKNAYKKLLNMAKDEKQPLDVRRRALEGLAGAADEEEIIELTSSFYNMDDMNAKVSALFVMGRSFSYDWSKEILESLNDSRKDIAWQAIWAAGETELQEAGPLLEKYISNPKNEYFESALYSYVKVAEREDVEACLDKLSSKDPDPEIQEILEEAQEIYEDRCFMEQLEDEEYDGEE